MFQVKYFPSVNEDGVMKRIVSELCPSAKLVVEWYDEYAQLSDEHDPTSEVCFVVVTEDVDNAVAAFARLAGELGVFPLDEVQEAEVYQDNGGFPPLKIEDREFYPQAPTK